MKRMYWTAVVIVVAVIMTAYLCVADAQVRAGVSAGEGQTSKHVLFTDNVLIDTTGDQEKLEASLVKDNLDDK